jgi:hypothetical protein
VVFLGLITFTTFTSIYSYRLQAKSQEFDDQGDVIPESGKIFDGMYANYTFEFLGASNNSIFRYSHVGGEFYNVTWNIHGSGSNSWIENSQNRVTSNSSGYYSYGDNRHTPIWIFTNTTIGDVMLIAVNGIFNYIFEVTYDITFDYPGLGDLEAWVLQDLGHYSGIARYEKNTGILLDGTFNWFRGSYNLSLLSTNIFSFYQGSTKLVPWYNHLILISFASVITIVIFKSVRHGSKLNPEEKLEKFNYSS